MNTLTPYEIWYGRNSPPPEQVKLKSGNLELIYQAGDLRYITFNGVELIRRIYVAIRDLNWNTIPASISELKVHAEENRFSISFHTDHRSGDLNYAWQAHIAGDADGRISYSMDGTVHTSFRYCRIGFCILHPIHECAGQPYQAETPAGLISGTLPIRVEPQRMEGKYEAPLFPACSNIVIGLKGKSSIHTTFEGDLFEMEDQRNWTDGSFKTYCTPLSLGYPKQAVAGQNIHQKVTLWLEQAQPIKATAPAAPGMDKTIHLTADEASSRHLPKIGFGMPSQPAPASPKAVELLTRLKPAHLKHEVHLKDPGWMMQLDLAMRATSQLKTKLGLTVFLMDPMEHQLDKLAQRLAGVPVAWFIIFHEKDAHLGSTSREWMLTARAHLGGAFQGVPIYGGTNGNFAELNRAGPDLTVMDGVSYTINSQVHSSDESSLVEALQGQADTASTALQISRGLPVLVSSLTMKPPFNPVANEEEPPPPPGELPPAVDPRQMSLFCAAWTLGSLRALSMGGAAEATYYETLGWRGLIETEQGSPLPEKFLSQPGMVFPVYHVFADQAEAKTAACIPLDATRPLAVTGMLFKHAARSTYLLANLTPEPQEIVIESIPQGKGILRRLNEKTAALAMFDPLSFRSATDPIELEKTDLFLSLHPYETIRLDIDYQ